MNVEGQILPARHTNKEHPLSWFQERLWLINRKNPDDVSYNIPILFQIEGPLDLDALNRSLSTIVNRHQILRARFITTASGQSAQVVDPEVDLRVPVMAVAHDDVVDCIRALRENQFNLTDGPVLVTQLLQLEPQKHLLLLNMHHIVADGWSIESILFAELLKCYQAYCSHQQPELPPLSVQYVDFARWQRQLDFSDALTHWHEMLADYEDSLEMPSDFPRQAQSGKYSDTFVHQYSKEFSSRLDRFSQTHNCTMFMSLMAGYGAVVSRYTGRDDICIGTTTSARTQPELENLIGFFVNILPLRLRVADDATVDDYLNTIRSLTLSAFDHQRVPFERILYSMGLERGGRADALVPLVLRHQNFPRTKMDNLLPGGVKFSPYSADGAASDLAAAGKLGRAAARCEIELSFVGDAESLSVEVMYASDLYKRETIERLLAHHEQILESMFADGSRPLRDLTLLRAADIERLCVTYNTTLPAKTGSGTFIERFETQALQTPDAIACYDTHGAWTYRQLALEVNRCTQEMLAQGVKSSDVVAVCMNRSASLLASMLAVWKCGAAYVPLDPNYPDTYLRQIIADAAPVRALCTSGYAAKLGLPKEQYILLDLLDRAPGDSSLNLPRSSCDPESLAYIMYTSGSTGTPKGVRVPHRQLINWLGGFEANWPFAPGEVVGQKTTMAFAVSVKELFAGLLNGCPQVFLDSQTVQDTAAFVAKLAECRVSRLNLVPSHLDAVLRHMRTEGLTLPAIKLCFTAGEPLTAEVVLAYRELFPNAQLWNNYGCTELNDICYYDTRNFEGSQGFVPIGRPIQNTQVYVLDRQGRLVPEGVAGELHVATASMSDGYQNRTDLTEERYLTNGFSKDPSSRLYNTGDVVRHLPGGDLEFIGRWDSQVKVRGFRVDVRQVEKILGEFPGVGARAIVGDGSHLLAFYTGQDGHELDLTALRDHLRSRLPDYMVPSAFIWLSALPRLPNGKLDRRALKPSLGTLQRSDTYEAPTTEAERKLVSIWSEVLEVPEDEIGRQTHFFEIGGHSLSATRVVARIKEKFGLDIALSLIFERPRLIELGVYLEEVDENEIPDIEIPGDEHGQVFSMLPNRRTVRGLLEDRVVLVTGASRGIGSATVRLLASQGAKVAINYVRNASRAQRVRDVIEQEGGIAEIFQADVTQVDQVTQLVSAVRDRFEKIDVLVSNAAIGFKIQPFIGYGWGDFERKINDELKSLFHLCQAVVPEMIERKSGSIIAVSSSMSKLSANGYIAHGTAKAALDAFVRALAIELGPDGIRVNTIAPGLTLTDASAAISPQQRDGAAARCPLRRNGLPRDVAGSVLFLASDLSQFLTGTYLPVDGGFTML